MADTEAIPQHKPPRPAPRANQSHTMEGKARPAPAPRSRPASSPCARSLARARPSPARRPLPPPGCLAQCVYKHKRHAEGPPACRGVEPPARPRFNPALGPALPPSPCAQCQAWNSGSPGLGRREGEVGGGGGRRRGG